MGKKDIQYQEISTQKKAGLAILISGKVDAKFKVFLGTKILYRL